MKKLISLILLFVSFNAVAGPSDSALYQKQWLKWRMKVPFWMDNGAYINNVYTSTRTNGDTILTWNPITNKIEKKIKLTLGNPADALTNPEMLRVNGGAYFDGEYGVTMNSPLQVNYGTTMNSALTVNDGDGIVVNNGGDVRATGVLSTAHTSGIGQVEFGQNASALAPKNTTNRTWYLPDSSGTLALTSMLSSGTVPTLWQVTHKGDSTDEAIEVGGLTSNGNVTVAVGNTFYSGNVTTPASNLDLWSAISSPTGFFNLHNFNGKYNFGDSTYSSSGTGTLYFPNFASASRTYTFPNASGTVALTSDITTSAWTPLGNTFSSGQYFGTNNNRGFGIRTNGKQSIYIDSMPRGARVLINKMPVSSDTSRLQVNGGLSVDTILTVRKHDSYGYTNYMGKVLSSGGSGHYFTTDTRGRASSYVTVDISDPWTPSSGSSDVIGLKIAPFAHPTGTSTGRLYGIYIAPNGVSGLTKYTSMYIGTPTTNDNWGIYQEASLLRNWFNGKVGIGTGKSSPVYGLDINCRVGINQDSLPTGASTDSVVMIRTSTNQLTKRAASSFGSSYTAGRGLTLNSSVFRLDTAQFYTWTNARTRWSAAPTATANYGLVSLGSGAFDGSTSGYFTGAAAGTLIAGNLASGSTSDLINLELAGASKFKVKSDGEVTMGTTGTTSIAANGYATLQYLDVPNYINSTYFQSRFSTIGITMRPQVAFAPTSGSATHSMVTIETTINQTGGANGITRGLYINPTLTSAADFRAIDIAKGVVLMATYTYATLPTGIPTGSEVNISDSNTTTWGATIAGGGANNVKARWNGTNWTVIGI